MRPHELTLRGFRSYRDEVTFDFRGRHLIGIVGPIGAGKSSILDGVSFALFGKTPRVQKETKSLIHQLSAAAHVRLTFEVDGQLWQVTRALKRKGQGQVQLVRLADDGAGEAPLETVVMERAVRNRVEHLLGMDFDTFGRSVLLAQNRFAEFLLTSDAPRNAVLKGVFGYERFDAALAAAREHVAGAEATVAALDADGSRLVEARGALAEARANASTAGERRDRLAVLRPHVERLDLAATEAEEHRAAAAADIARTRRAADMLPAAAALDDASADADRTAEAVANGTEAVATAEAERVRAEAARDEATERIGDLQAFADLVARLHAHAEAVTAAIAARDRSANALEAGAGAAAAARAGADAAAASLADAETALQGSTSALAVADDELHAARHAEMAAELRGGLLAGEPCPVCAHVVATVPKAIKAAGLRQAERVRTTAAKRHDAAVKARDRVAVAVAA
ncbi:MAG: SMC family ATPase, partial [Actinomycetota bacterium]